MNVKKFNNKNACFIYAYVGNDPVNMNDPTGMVTLQGRFLGHQQEHIRQGVPLQVMYDNIQKSSIFVTEQAIGVTPLGRAYDLAKIQYQISTGKLPITDMANLAASEGFDKAYEVFAKDIHLSGISKEVVAFVIKRAINIGIKKGTSDIEKLANQELSQQSDTEERVSRPSIGMSKFKDCSFGKCR